MNASTLRAIHKLLATGNQHSQGATRIITFPRALQTISQLCLVLLFLDRAVARGEYIYSVQGRLRYEVFEPKLLWEETFTVSVSNCLWAITVIRDQSKDVVFKQVYDGESLTMSSLFLNMQIEPKKGRLANDAALSVELDDTPNSTAPIGMGQIWLAYASGCKLSMGNSGLLEPAWLIPEQLRRSRFKTQATWNLLPSAPFLPTNIDFFHDEDAFQEAMKGGMPKTGDHPPAAKNLWTSFQVTSVTNVASYIFPRHFVFQAYQPGRPDLRKDPVLAYTYTGDIELVALGETRDSLTPGFGKRTIVQDTRLGNWSNPIVPVTYLVTNRVIPATNDPKLLKLYATWNLGHLPGPAKTSSTKPLIFFVTVIAVITFPLLWLMKQHRKM
jgi:hypothetical protein